MVLTHQATRSGKLLTFLRGELDLSSSLVKRLKWQGALAVNGRSVHTDFPVQPGDTITVTMEEAPPDYPAQEGTLSILYEDESLIAIDKPAGLLMHPSFYRTEGTLANYLLGYYEKTGQPCAVHPVSRLDRDTFGVVLFAKNGHIHARMMLQLKSGRVEKTYHALVLGTPPEAGSWAFPIDRCPGESLLRRVAADGKPAVTKYRCLETDATVSLLSLQPVTGRTHQLRVHCAHAGYPILGDRQYGTALSIETGGFAHQQLCARKLSFLHPVTGQTITLESHYDTALSSAASSAGS